MSKDRSTKGASERSSRFVWQPGEIIIIDSGDDHKKSTDEEADTPSVTEPAAPAPLKDENPKKS